MKRILLVFSLIMLTAGFASAQTKEAAIAVVDGDVVYDFGDIKEADGPAIHTFKITNKGTTPLMVTKVTASCGCTTPEWTKEPIAPGKTGEIKVTYDTANRPSTFSKTISVFSKELNSDANNGTFILSIKGNVIPKS